MKEQNEPPPISTREIDQILAFIPDFRQRDFEKLTAFVEAVHDLQIIYSFDWSEFVPETQHFMEYPELLASADLLTIRKMLTAHVRGDRFNDGHLMETIRSGHLVAILERLRDLRLEMDSSVPIS